MSHSEEELLTVEEAARMLKVSSRTVSRYRAEGRFPFMQYSARKFLYRRSDIKKFIDNAYRPPLAYLE